ncbi:hypothetical protein YC2023_064542 [Brassica napus]
MKRKPTNNLRSTCRKKREARPRVETSTAREPRVTQPYTRHRRVITASSPRHRRIHADDSSPQPFRRFIAASSSFREITADSPHRRFTQPPETKSHHSSLEDLITLPRNPNHRRASIYSRTHPGRHQHTYHPFAYISPYIRDQADLRTDENINRLQSILYLQPSRKKIHRSFRRRGTDRSSPGKKARTPESEPAGKPKPVLKVGVGAGIEEVMKWGEEEIGVLVDNEGVKKAVEELMGAGDDAKERSRRAKELGKLSHRAMYEEGSSYSKF